MTPEPDLVFLGTTSELSRTAFQVLLTNGVVPQGVVMPSEVVGMRTRAPIEQLLPTAPVGQLPLVNRYHQPSLIHAAWSAKIPTFAWRSGHDQALFDLLGRFTPDAACVVCFPHRFPESVLTMPTLGFLNVHPSLLPHYRGPDPLFWLFQRDDHLQRGITVHQMDQGLDTGPLVMQESINFADGQGQVMIDRQCGVVGGRLLLQAIKHLSSGENAIAQHGDGSYFPWPETEDYRLNISWPALRAYNFMRATNGTSAVYPVRLSGDDIILKEAVQVQPEAEQDMPVIFDGATAHLQFNPGVLTAKLASSAEA